MISKGLVEEARENADFNVRQLHTFVEDGYSIVGCEPSCILTFRDEYPDLVRNSHTADVAQASFLLEEFIVKETSPLRSAGADSFRLLKRIPTRWLLRQAFRAVNKSSMRPDAGPCILPKRWSKRCKGCAS
jgi:Fe-S oxidoreductase